MTVASGGSAAALHAAVRASVAPRVDVGTTGGAPWRQPADGTGGSGRQPAAAPAATPASTLPVTAAATSLLAQSLAQDQPSPSLSTSRQAAAAYASRGTLTGPPSPLTVVSPLPLLGSGRTVDLSV